MSLKGRWRMLGSDRQHAGWRAVEPGADPGVFGSQPGGSVRWKTAWGGVRVDHTNPATAALPGTRQSSAGITAALCSEDDGTEPVAGNSAGSPLRGTQPGPAKQVPASPVPEPLPAVRYRTAGQAGRSARNPERAGDQEDPRARISALWAPAIRTAHVHLGGPPLQPTKEPALPRMPAELHQDAARGGGHWRAAKAGTGRPARLPAGRHSAPRGPGWNQGRVSHQRRRPGHAMASGGGHSSHQPSTPGAGFAGYSGAVSVSGEGLPFRQRLGVYQR